MKIDFKRLLKSMGMALLVIIGSIIALFVLVGFIYLIVMTYGVFLFLVIFGFATVIIYKGL